MSMKTTFMLMLAIFLAAPAVSEIKKDTGKLKRPDALQNPKIQKEVNALKQLRDALADKIKSGEQKGFHLQKPKLSLVVANIYLDNDFTFRRGYHEPYPIVEKNLPRLKSILSQASTQVDQIMAGQVADLFYEDPSYKNLEIRDGAIYSGDRPVLLFGFRAGTIFKNYLKAGYNLQRLGIHPRGEWSGVGGKKGQMVDAAVDFLKEADRHNIAIDAELQGHFLPPEFYEEHPQAGVRKTWWKIGSPGASIATHSWTSNIEHPKARSEIMRFYREVVPRLQGYPSLFCYELANEPGYVTYTPQAQRMFLAYCKKKFKTVERMNELLDADFKDFKTIRYPEDGARWGRYLQQKASRALQYEYHMWNFHHVLKYYKQIRDIIWNIDPNDRPIHVKNHVGNEFMGDWSGYRFNGHDIELLNRHLMQIAGMDSGTYWKDNQEIPLDFWNGIFFSDLARSVAPDNPVYDSEWHLLINVMEFEPSENAPAEVCRMALLQSLFHGRYMNLMWHWADNSFPSRAHYLHSLTQTFHDAKRLAEPIIRLNNVKPRIALYYSLSSYSGNDKIYLDSLKTTYKALYFQDQPVLIVTDQMIQNGALDEIALLFVPRSDRVPQKTFDAIARYVEKGGRLLLTGDSFLAGEYGQPHERNDVLGYNNEDIFVDSELDPTLVMPIKVDNQKLHPQKWIVTPPGLDSSFTILAQSGDQPILAERSFGKGTILYQWAGLSDKHTHILYAHFLKKYDLMPKMSTTPGQWGVEARYTDYNGKKLFYLINTTRVPIPFKVKDPGLQWHNLFTDKKESAPSVIKPFAVYLYEETRSNKK